MLIPRPWPNDIKEKLFSLCDKSGASWAELGSEVEARSFRQSLYYYRRNRPEWARIAIILDGPKVHLSKNPDFNIQLFPEEEDQC